MDKGREGEKDLLFETKMEVGGEEGMVIERRTERFEFVLIIPPELAPHDYHDNGTVSHELFAELHGYTQSETSDFTTSSTSPEPSTSYFPTPSTPLALPDDATLPSVPPYEQVQHQISDVEEVVSGTHSASRSVMLVYNPDPSGGVNSLQDSLQEVMPGLGVCEFRLKAAELTVAGLLSILVNIPSPSPTTTVFALNVRLSQTHTLISPRDGTTLPTTRSWLLHSIGKRPEIQHVHPSKHLPAMWRGVEAGGKDKDGWRHEARARLPKGNLIRPSTLHGVLTPIRVSHNLIFELFFSVYGEEASGKPMSVPNPGALRLLKWVRPIIIPGCSLISGVIDLPIYPSEPSKRLDRYIQPQNAPCPLCHKRPHENLCETCAASTTPHLRHDEHRVAPCPMCTQRSVVPGGPADPLYRNFVCACVDWEGKDLGGEEFGKEEEVEITEGERTSQKVAAERGRTMRIHSV